MLAKAAQSLVSAMRDKITPEFAWKDFPYKAERIVALGYRDEIIAKLSENGLTNKISLGIEEGYKHLRDAMQEIKRD